MAEAYHYRPDVYSALCEAIPLICRSKRDVLTFFRGAGLSGASMAMVSALLRDSPVAFKKYDVTRQLLDAANEDLTDGGLRVRREIIKRVVDFNAFENCWPDKQQAAKGAVVTVRELVHEKDAFARMAQAHDTERAARMAESARKAEALRRKAEQRENLKRDLFALVARPDPHARGRAFEEILGRLFTLDGLLGRQSFRRNGDAGEGIVEQIDGVVEIDNRLYLVEAKWWQEPLGVGDVAQHMVRVASRSGVGGLYIVHPGFTQPAITTVREGLQRGTFVLATVEELVGVLESTQSIAEWLRERIHEALIDKQPYRARLKNR
jgi:hypothetical protein